LNPLLVFMLGSQPSALRLAASSLAER